MKNLFLFLLAFLWALPCHAALLDTGAVQSLSAINQSNGVYVTSHTTCDQDISSDLFLFKEFHGRAVMPPGCYLVNDLLGGTTGYNISEQIPGTVTYKYDTGHYFIHNTDTHDTTLFDSKTTISDICVGDNCTGIQTVNTDDKLTRLTVASVGNIQPGDYVKIVDSVSLPSRIGATKTITGIAWNSGTGKCVVTTSSNHGYSNSVQIFLNAVTGTGSIGSLTGQDGTTFTGAVGKFTVGDTVTGGTSGATALVRAVTYKPNSSTAGVLTIKSTTGVFAAAETITGTLSGSATVAVPFGWGRAYNITSESNTTFSLQTLDNSGGSSVGSNVDCSTGSYTSGGTSSQKNGWAGEADRVAQVDPIGKYVYLVDPLEYLNLYVDQPVLYRFTAPYTVNIQGGTVSANGDTSDVTNQTASNAAVDIIGIPDPVLPGFKCKNTWDACVILQGCPGIKVDNLKSRLMPNRATLVTGTPHTVTNVTSANPAVFTSAGHGFTTSSQLGFLSMPTGWGSFVGHIYHPVNITTDTFQLQDTNNQTLNSTGFPAWSGTTATADTDDVTGLGYTISLYGTDYGAVINGIECWEGRHCVTTDGQQSTWTATPSSSSAIWGQGQPTYFTVENGVAHGVYGIAWDTHQEAAKGLFKNLTCYGPIRGYEYGTYKGGCWQARGKDITYDNVRQYGGSIGGYIRAVNNAHDSPPRYTFINTYTEGLRGLNDNLKTTSTVGDSTAFVIEDGTANIFWPIVDADNISLRSMYIGIDAPKGSEVHVGRMSAVNVKEPVRAAGGSLFEAEDIVDDRRGMNYSYLSSASVTSWTPTSGAKSFQVAANGAYRPNMAAVITSDSSPSTIYGVGKVQSISGTTLSILVNSFAGSGSHTDWHIVAGWPTVQMRSDSTNGGPTARIRKLHTYSNTTLPAIVFGEDDATATKSYSIELWSDTATSPLSNILVSPWATTLSLLSDTVTRTTPGAPMGTKFTASGCSNSATLGGPSTGQFTSGTTGTCTVALTFNGATGTGALNPTGWACMAQDITTPADIISQTATTATTATIAGTTVSGDVITFNCAPY